MPATVKSLEEQVDEIAEDLGDLKEKVNLIAHDFASLKGRLEVTLQFLRWLGGFAAAVGVTIVIFLFTVARTAGRLDATVEQQSTSLNKMESRIEKMELKMETMSGQLTELRTLLKNPPKQQN